MELVIVLTQREANELLALATSLPVGASVGQYMAMVGEIQALLTAHVQPFQEQSFRDEGSQLSHDGVVRSPTPQPTRKEGIDA